MEITMAEKEKRGPASRNCTETAVTCRPFTSGSAIHTADGVMRNFSDGGVYIETSREFKLGTILHLRMVHYPSRPLSLAAEALPRSTCLVEVKWLQKMVGENIIQYGFGLRYID